MKLKSKNSTSSGLEVRVQRGFIALGTAMVLLLLVTMGTIYVSRSVVMEQRVSSNDVRAKAALEAAEAGRNFSIAFMDVDDRDLDGDGTSDRAEMLTSLSVTDDISDGSGKEYDDCDLNSDGDCADTGETAAGSGYLLQGMWNAGTATYDWSVPSGTSCDAGYRACVRMKMGDAKYKLVLRSEGRSDDLTAEKVVIQDIRYANPFGLAGPPTHPLITFSVVDVGGSMLIANPFTNATVWSGKNVESFGGGASSQAGTLIHPNIEGTQYEQTVDGVRIPYDSSGTRLLDYSNNNPISPNDLTKSTISEDGVVVLGVDVIDNSTALANSKNTDPDGFFKNFFTGSPDYVKASVDYITTDDRLADPKGEFGVNGSMIWVDMRNADDTLGTFSLKNGSYGSPEAPIILIVDGHLDLQASPDIYGVLFVRGDVVGGGSGGGTVFGSAIIEGDNGVAGSGGFDVVYDPNLLTMAGGGTGRVAASGISGSWRDWE